MKTRIARRSGTVVIVLAGILLALGILLLAAPDVIPALTIPGAGPMPAMEQMGS